MIWISESLMEIEAWAFNFLISLFFLQVIHRLPSLHLEDELHHSGWNACSRLIVIMMVYSDGDNRGGDRDGGHNGVA